MKNKSLIFKITVWFSVAVIIISGAAVFVTLDFIVSGTKIQRCRSLPDSNLFGNSGRTSD